MSLYFNEVECGFHEKELFLNHLSMHASHIKDSCVYLIHTCMHAKEIKYQWTKVDGEKTLKPEIEKFLAFSSPYPFYIEERNDQA